MCGNRHAPLDLHTRSVGVDVGPVVRSLQLAIGSVDAVTLPLPALVDPPLLDTLPKAHDPLVACHEAVIVTLRPSMETVAEVLSVEALIVSASSWAVAAGLMLNFISRSAVPVPV